MNLNDHPDVVRALKALPASIRYLPSWCALRYLKFFASPLHRAILKSLDVPEEQWHGLWADIARKFNVHARTIYRHRDEQLLLEITRLTMIFTVTFLLIHQQWGEAEKLFTWLKNLRA